MLYAEECLQGNADNVRNTDDNRNGQKIIPGRTGSLVYFHLGQTNNPICPKKRRNKTAHIGKADNLRRATQTVVAEIEGNHNADRDSQKSLYECRFEIHANLIVLLPLQDHNIGLFAIEILFFQSQTLFRLGTIPGFLEKSFEGILHANIAIMNGNDYFRLD